MGTPKRHYLLADLENARELLAKHPGPDPGDRRMNAREAVVFLRDAIEALLGKGLAVQDIVVALKRAGIEVSIFTVRQALREARGETRRKRQRASGEPKRGDRVAGPRVPASQSKAAEVAAPHAKLGGFTARPDTRDI